MDLKGILSVSGQPGLYKHVAQATNGIVIESLIDKKRQLAHATSRISALEDISIYTDNGDIKLSEVYKNMFNTLEGKATAFDPKKASNDEIKDLFENVLPQYDKERVYISDMKRAFVWYNLLLNAGLVDGNDEETNPEEESISENPEDKSATPVKTRTRKPKAENASEPKAPKAVKAPKVPKNTTGVKRGA